MANDTTYSLLPHVFKKLPFDHEQRPGAGQPRSSSRRWRVVVDADSRFKTLADLLAAAKANPGKLNYGTGGAGTTPHFVDRGTGERGGDRAVMHVPFKGAGEATLALLSGTIDFQIASTPGVMGQVKGGKVRLLAISGDKRLAALPDVPTFAEAGVKDYGVINFTGLWAPKGTPPGVLAQLQKEIAKAMASADMKAFAEALAAIRARHGRHAFAKHAGRDTRALWARSPPTAAKVEKQ